MALGFRDCCNSSSYFYLNGIPGSVSPNDVYEIITLEGPIFCATYTTVPLLNYSPPTYNLIEMTMQDNSQGLGCQTCIESNPCPSVQSILLSQFGVGSIAIGTDCDIKTMFPMTVQCDIENPSFDGFADGIVRLIVTGGTYPYTFFSAGTNPPVYFGSSNPDPNIPAPPDNTYVVVGNAAEGIYNITTVDAQADYVINSTCILDSPPPPLVVTLGASPVSIIGECDGQLTINIAGGTPPYQIVVNGIPVTVTTLTDLCAGDYQVTVIDSGQLPNLQIVTQEIQITNPNPIVYPDNICLTVGPICSTTFYLDFELTDTLYNFRPVFNCTNPNVLGLTTLVLRWEENSALYGATPYTGWGIPNLELSNGNVQFNVNCAQSVNNSFIRFTKITPETEQPVGPYSSDIGFLSGLPAAVSSGVCVPVFTEGGCTDPAADNYNPNATFDDGSCTYGGGGGGGGAPIPLTISNVSISAAPCGQANGSVIIFPQGGTPPYTYFVNGTSYATPTIALPPGNYTYYVTDNGNPPQQTGSFPFTIIQTSPTPISMTFTSTIDTTDPIRYTQQLSPQGISSCSGINGIVCDGSSSDINSNQITLFNYPIYINGAINGLSPGQTVTGYFILTLKLQDAFTLDYPDCISYTVDYNYNFVQAGDIIINDNLSVTYDPVPPFPPASLVSDTTVVRPNGINPNLLQPNQSLNCVPTFQNYDDVDNFFANDNSYGCDYSQITAVYGDSVAGYQDFTNQRWGSSRKQVWQYQYATNAVPIIFNEGDTFEIWIQFNSRFRPIDGGTCQPAKGFQWELEFVKTSSDISCTTFVFNGATYAPGQKYLGSVKQVGNQQYPNIITNTKIID